MTEDELRAIEERLDAGWSPMVDAADQRRLVAEVRLLTEALEDLISWEFGGWNGPVLSLHVDAAGECQSCKGIWPCAIERARAALDHREGEDRG